MSLGTTNPGRALVYIVAIVAAVGSFAITQGSEIVAPPYTLTPRTVYGVIAPLIVVVVALGQLFGSDTPVGEKITLTHVAIGITWAIYLLAGVALVIAGYTGWVVLGNLAIAISAGLIFGYLYTRK
jgi:hypothetical protein